MTKVVEPTGAAGKEGGDCVRGGAGACGAGVAVMVVVEGWPSKDAEDAGGAAAATVVTCTGGWVSPKLGVSWAERRLWRRLMLMACARKARLR
jgi:hypothetical protein